MRISDWSLYVCSSDLTSRLASPELALLYGELAAQDSGQIVARLEQMSVPYQLSEEGGKIFVPQDQVGRMRMVMAEEGLPSGGSVGYEIFEDRKSTRLNSSH